MEPRLKKTALIVLTLAALLFFTNSSLAATPTVIAGPCEGTRALLPVLPGAPDPCSSPAAYVVYWFYLSLYLAGIAALLILVFAGFMRLSSGLVPNAISSANKMVTGAALGLILLFSGWLLLNTLNPKLLKVGNSSFPPLGGCLMTFQPGEVGANQSSTLSWALFFEKQSYGRLDCQDREGNPTIKNEKVALSDDRSYKSDVEGKHFCRLTARDADDIILGLCDASLIVTPACTLTWAPGATGSGQGELTWTTSTGAKKADLTCFGGAGAEVKCQSGKFSYSCSYAPPGKGSTTAKKGSVDTATCAIEITKPWHKICEVPVTFP